MPADAAPPGDDLPAGQNSDSAGEAVELQPDTSRRRRRRRTGFEWLAIAGTFTTALICLAVAAALVFAYLVVRQKNVVELADPAVAAAERDDELDVGGADVVVDTVAPATTVAPPTTTVAPSSSAPETATTVPDRSTATTTAGDGTTVAADTAVAETTVAGTTVAGAAGTAADTTAPSSTSVMTTPVDSDDTRAARTTVELTPPASSAAAAAPDSTFPEADPAAKNFLITGADNGACIDPDSPYADAFGDRDDMGERSDTIMVVRVDPAANRVAVLSFPRDLWVEIADTGSMQRINSAYQRNEPQRLVDTIYYEFGIEIDHYIQFDFCAFKTLVDSVGGVDVPFEYPTRDTHTGLLVETPGCVNLDGEAALAYVRSRYYEYDPTGDGDWETDGTSDLGRIARQQDFIRRTLATVSDKGLSPDVIRGLLKASDDYIVTDRQLTPKLVLEFAGVMNRVDPDAIVTYQVESTPRQINGNSVLIPELESDTMQQVLALFRGEISLGEAPAENDSSAAVETTVADDEQTSATAADTSPDESNGDESNSDGSNGDADATDDGGTAAVATGSVPEQTSPGIVPPAGERC